MNFFKSVFSDEPDSPKPESDSSQNQFQSDPRPKSPPEQQDTDPTDDGGGGGWSFGGLLKTISTKSESVIETYRRDLKEFGSGLRKEIEVAQGSLGDVSHAIDEIGSSVLKSTAQIISQGKDAILAIDQESDSSDTIHDRSIASQQSLNSKPYSRFEAQVRVIQCDASTYSEEPEDSDDYEKWKSGFVLGERREESEGLLQENGAMESIYKTLVPGSVDEETFWSRYFYRVYKLKQAEDLRANIVKRAISTEEEDLSWDVDDDEEEEEEKSKRNGVSETNVKESKDLDDAKESLKSSQVEETNEIEEMGSEESHQIAKSDANKEPEQIVSVLEESKEVKVSSGSENAASEKVELEETSKEESSSKRDEERGLEGKDGSNGETSKDSDFSVVSSHPSNAEEDDLGWDEIEDLSGIDEKKASSSGSPNKIDFRKRLSVAEEEEDLSWDIEDDDEPVKA